MTEQTSGQELGKLAMTVAVNFHFQPDGAMGINIVPTNHVTNEEMGNKFLGTVAFLTSIIQKSLIHAQEAIKVGEEQMKIDELPKAGETK